VSGQGCGMKCVFGRSFVCGPKIWAWQSQAPGGNLTSGRRVSRIGPGMSGTLFDSLGLDLVMLREVDQILDLLPRRHELRLADAGVIPGVAQLGERALEEMESVAEHHLRLDARDISHLLQLLAREEGTPVAVAAALHVDQRQPADPRRALGVVGIAREEQAEIGPHVRGAIDPHAGFVEPQGAAGVGARDDDEVAIAFVALAAREPDLLGELVRRDPVHHVLVVVRALRIELVLDVHPGDPGPDALAHGSHRVQRVAEARATVSDERDVDALRDVPGDPDLLGHRQQRLGQRRRSAADVAAYIRGFVAQRLDQASPDRIVDRRHVEKSLLPKQGSQLGAWALHAECRQRQFCLRAFPPGASSVTAEAEPSPFHFFGSTTSPRKLSSIVTSSGSLRKIWNSFASGKLRKCISTLRFWMRLRTSSGSLARKAMWSTEPEPRVPLGCFFRRNMSRVWLRSCDARCTQMWSPVFSQ